MLPHSTFKCRLILLAERYVLWQFLHEYMTTPGSGNRTSYAWLNLPENNKNYKISYTVVKFIIIDVIYQSTEIREINFLNQENNLTQKTDTHMQLFFKYLHLLHYETSPNFSYYLLRIFKSNTNPVIGRPDMSM